MKKKIRITRKIKAPNDVFLFPPRFWTNKIKNACGEEEKLGVVSEMAGELLAAWFYGTDHYIKLGDVAKLVKILDRQASYLVLASSGIQEGFRLAAGWFRVVIVQLGISGAIEAAKGDELTGDRIVKLYRSQFVEYVEYDRKSFSYAEKLMIRLLDRFNTMFKGFGWENIEECLNPVFDRTRTVINISYFKHYDDEGREVVGTFPLILEPVSAFPIGSVWVSKSGKEWEVVELRGEFVCCLPETEPYRMKAFSQHLVRTWKRIF